MNAFKVGLYATLGYIAAGFIAFLIGGGIFIGIVLAMYSAESKGADVPAPAAQVLLNNTYRLGVNWTEERYFEDEGIVRTREAQHMGTGFWITPKIMVTNCHVGTMDRSAKIQATSWHHNQTYKMRMVLCDELSDIAVLVSYHWNGDVLPVEIASTELRFGQEVYSAGHGLDFGLSVKVGYASTLITSGQAYTIPIISGDSGSPVLNKDGQLQGLMHSGLAAPQPSGLGVPLADKAMGTTNAELLAMLRNLEVRIERSGGMGDE